MRFFLWFLLTTTASIPALAEDLPDEVKLSAAQAATLAGRYHPGQVMNVTLEAGTKFYGVKILNNGHIKIVYVDAVSGTISFPSN